MAIVKEKRQRINDEISAREVRLIDAKGEQLGIVLLSVALNQAQEDNLDLVEISPSSEPPVCKIMDYGKFKYQETKRAHEAKQKQKQVQIKEVQFRPGTDENDYQIKLKRMIRFLSDTDKVKVKLRFRGREMARKELGMKVLDKVKEDLQEFGQVEQYPQMEGRMMVMVLSPLKK